MSANKRALGAASDKNAPKDEVATIENNVPSLTVKQMVEDINDICRTSVNGGKLQIGEYLLENIFKGNVEEASSKNPKKNTSYADLAKSPDLDLSDKELGICLRVAVLERILKKKSPELCDLMFSVKREIVKLPGVDKMLELAREAYSDGLTVGQTREKVQAMIPHAALDLGKKVLSKLNHPLGLMSNEELKSFCADKSRLIKDLNKKERTKIRNSARAKRSEIEECVDFLKGFEETLEEIDAD